MKTTYEAVRPLEPGKPVAVVERNEAGALVGAYHGYWNFKSGTVSLYPDIKNRFVNWPEGRVPKDKRVISDRYIKCKVQNTEQRLDNSAIQERKGESWKDRKLPIKGQERMDI